MILELVVEVKNQEDVDRVLEAVRKAIPFNEVIPRCLEDIAGKTIRSW